MKKLILNPGDTVNLNECEYEVITATSNILSNNESSINLMTMLFHLKNEATGEVISMHKDEILASLSKCRECGEKVIKGSFCSEEHKESYLSYLNDF